MPNEVVHLPPTGGRRRELTLTVGRARGTVVVTAQGTLDVVGSRLLRGVVADLINNQGNLDVAIDLHAVTDVDDGCLDIFVAARGWAAMRGGRLRLTGATGRVGRALEESGVARLVQATGDRILAVPTAPAAVARNAHPAGRAWR